MCYFPMMNRITPLGFNFLAAELTITDKTKCMKLIKYEYVMTRFFGDGEYETIYELTLLKTCFFGLLKRVKKINYTIPMFENVKNYTDHWDYQILTEAEIR